MRTISITAGKKRLDLVFGLVWHPLKSNGSARAKEIKALAKESSFDFQVLRGTDSAHIGFARKIDGAKAGQISAAAVIAESIAVRNGKRNFLFAVQLPDEPDQYLFVSAHEGVILVDGDLVGTQEEIRLRLTQDATYGGWNAIICPVEWGVPKAVDKGFNFFFNEESLDSAKKWALKETHFNANKLFVVAIALAVIAGGGFYEYNAWKKNEAFKAEQLRLAFERQQQAMMGTTPLPEPIKPWPTMVKPEPFVRACVQALERVGTAAGNWKLKSIECTPGGLAVSWSKPNASAWVSHLKEIRPQVFISDDGAIASITEQLHFAVETDDSEKLPSADGNNYHYQDLGSRYGMSVTLSAPLAPPAPVLLPGQAPPKVPPPPPFWEEIPVRIDTTMDPIEAIHVLLNPGLRFQTLSIVNNNGAMQYTLTGAQYARR